MVPGTEKPSAVWNEGISQVLGPHLHLVCVRQGFAFCGVFRLRPASGCLGWPAKSREAGFSSATLC